MRLAVALLVCGCGQTGYVTGGTVKECGSFNNEQSNFVDMGLQLVVCPRLAEYFEDRPCTANALTDILHEVTLYFYAQGEDYCIEFDPPPDD